MLLLVLAASGRAAAQPFAPDLWKELKWRSIGPYRGGRTKAAVGIPDQPHVFYVGVCNGGVWKTNDAGRTWQPLFDEQPTGSIGALAIAPSQPNILYVGSGEGLQRPDLSTGDGIYKSTDGGRTWRHLGLRDGQQIPQIIVDPRNPNRLFVAVLGHPYGPNPERGIFRSLDGGESFQKVLYKDADTGGVDVAFDPQNPDAVYAVLWESRQAPWENGEFEGPGSGLFKSTDGGTSWRPIGKGLPSFERDGLGRIGIAVAPSSPKRMFATVEARRNRGLYRSDDAGETFFRVSSDERVTERASDFAEVRVHPKNPDIVLTASVVVWKSTDGGKTFVALRGAPGGDDYHRIWINPKQPDIMLVASDQGALVTLNGGQSWSSWYNQPTAQMFHIAADNAFPYRVCGSQQESGSACVSSRGIDGAITFREWHSAGFEEYGYAAPDPLDSDLVYGGKLSRYDRRTGQSHEIGPMPVREPGYRTVRTQPVVFSPIDPHTLYFASNTLWKTRNGGRTWTRMSPDLTRKTWELPKTVAKYASAPGARVWQRGVLYTVAPSRVDAGTIWVGSDDGLIHVTHDGGKSWHDVTPPDLSPWAKVSLIDASPWGAGTAYAAINTLRLDDLRPHIYRTHDGGRTWTPITSGLPDGADVNVVRADPKRKGLLYAGTERSVYVSFDDGASWQPLRLNLPATSVRDLVVKDDDLIAGTHGRGIWILDDIAPLREIDAKIAQAEVHLFRPQPAWRIRHSTNPDTPLPPDEATGSNPPDGALIDYALKAPAAGAVMLEILDAKGHLVRRFSSQDPAPPLRDEDNIPSYWIRPPQIPSAQAGLHRLVWDLHYPPPSALEHTYSLAAVPHDTPREPRGPVVLPGSYVVKLSVAGQSYSQPLTVKMDPRIKTPAAGLRQQFELSQRLAEALQKDSDALVELRKLRADLKRQGGAGAPGAAGSAGAADLDSKLAALEGTPAPRFQGAEPTPPKPALLRWNERLAKLLETVQAADLAASPALAQAAEKCLKEVADLLARWNALKAPAGR
ncbi:MAG TPA: glycoside hydrolase [Polyangia bacterium]|nr:glycoside hydrolase [Polyangia bacterium]